MDESFKCGKCGHPYTFVFKHQYYCGQCFTFSNIEKKSQDEIIRDLICLIARIKSHLDYCCDLFQISTQEELITQAFENYHDLYRQQDKKIDKLVKIAENLVKQNLELENKNKELENKIKQLEKRFQKRPPTITPPQ